MQTLTQEAVKEQIREFIAHLTRQLEGLTRLVQGMTTSRYPNSYPRTELGTTSGTAMPQSDTHGMKFIHLRFYTVCLASIMEDYSKILF